MIKQSDCGTDSTRLVFIPSMSKMGWLEESSGLCCYLYRYANAVSFHPDGNCIAIGTTDNSIKIWDIRVNRLLQYYQGIIL